MSSKSNYTTEELVFEVIDSVQDVKGKKIVTLNLSKLDYAICEYFVICHGTSNTHVDALASNIEKKVRERLHLKTIRKEGVENAEWIILDYGDVMVHVFQEEPRELYKIEELWADAELQQIEDN